MAARPSAGRAFRALALCAFFTPIILLASLSLWRDGRPSLAAYAETFHIAHLPLLLNTAGMAAGATVLALLLGGGAAAVFERRVFPFRGSLRVASLAPLLLPPVFQVAAWERLALPGGLLESLLQWAPAPGKPFPIRNLAFAAFVLGLSYSPVLFVFASEGLRRIPRELVDAASLTSRSPGVWFSTIIPLCVPHAAAGAGLTFTLAFLNYEVPRLLDGMTYPVLINVQYGALDDPGLAFAAVLPGMLFAGALLLLAESWAERRGFALTDRERPELLAPERRAGPLAWGAMLGWWACSFLLPLAVLVQTVGKPRVLALAWRTDWEKVLWGGAVTGCSALAAALLAGLFLLPPRGAERGSPVLLWMPLALPGSLLGFSLARICRVPLLSEVYDSWLILVVAAVARFFPAAYFALGAHLRTVPGDEWEAAELLAGGRQRWFGVRIPRAAPGLAASAATVALLQSAELPATVFLAPPGHEPLIVRIYNLLHYDPERDVLAALCLFHIASVLVIAGLLAGAGKLAAGGRRRRQGGGSLPAGEA